MTDRDRETERDRERQTNRERDTERQRQRRTERQRQRQSRTARDRDRERDREGQRDRERNTKSEYRHDFPKHTVTAHAALHFRLSRRKEYRWNPSISSKRPPVQASRAGRQHRLLRKPDTE